MSPRYTATLWRSQVRRSTISWKYPGADYMPNGMLVCKSTPQWVLLAFWWQFYLVVCTCQIDICEVVATTESLHQTIWWLYGVLVCLQLVVYTDLVIPVDTKLCPLLSWCRCFADWYHVCPIFIELGKYPYPFFDSSLVSLVQVV